MAMVNAIYHTPDCIVDYSKRCPNGWIPSPDEPNICLSHLMYTGICSTKIVATNNIRDKVILQETCGLKWPCENICDKDYDRCPEYWYLDHGECYPAYPYSSGCNKGEKLDGMDLSEKIMWSNKCSVDWNCRSECKKDYSQICPKDWILSESNLCEAPSYYVGPCYKIADLSYFDRKMKLDFEIACNVIYPCI